MATSKGFENKDSKSERTEGAKQSGGSTFDVLDLLGMPKDMQKGIKNAVHQVEQAVDGLKHLVEQAADHKPHTADTHKADTNHGFKRGDLLNNPTHHAEHPLIGRITKNESHHNPSHLSAFLLKRLHENKPQTTDFGQQEIAQQSFNFEQPTRFDQQPMNFVQQEPMNFGQQEQAPHRNTWQEARYAYRENAAMMALAAGTEMAKIMPGHEYNPNVVDGSRLQELQAQGLPFTRPIEKDLGLLPVILGRREQFRSHIAEMTPSYYPHQDTSYYQPQRNNLPRGGFQSHMQYYRRQS